MFSWWITDDFGNRVQVPDQGTLLRWLDETYSEYEELR